MKNPRRIAAALVLLIAALRPAGAQTQEHLTAQSKGADFSKASSTNSAQPAPSLPGVCSEGQVFFDSAAAAGKNLYGCAAPNTWRLLGSAAAKSDSGPAAASHLGDFVAVNTSPAVQTFGASCSPATPCRVRIGAAEFAMKAPVTLTIGGAVGNGTVYYYLSPGMTLTAGTTAGATLTCSAGCSLVTGITSFPSDSVPLWQSTFTENVWDPINILTMDKRAIYSRDVIAMGPGVTSMSNPSTGVQTFSTDPTVVPRYLARSGAPKSSCTAGRDFYTDTAGLNLYFCDAANTWKLANSASTVTDSTYVRYWAGAGAAHSGNGSNLVGPAWVTDSNLASATASIPFAAISIAPAPGAHFAYLSAPVPVGWTGAVGLRSFYTLNDKLTGSGTGVHAYSLACITPGTTNLANAISWSTAVTVPFNVTAHGVGATDNPSFTGKAIPTCNPGTLAAPTGAFLLVRIVRQNTGTATDETYLYYFDVSLPHKVQ